MTESKDKTTLTLAVSGAYQDFVEPPEELHVSIIERKTTRGFEGFSLLHLLLSIDWSLVAQSAASGATGKFVYDLAKWLFARFSPKPKPGQESVETQARIDVKLNDKTTVLLVTSAEDLAAKLQELLNDEHK